MYICTCIIIHVHGLHFFKNLFPYHWDGGFNLFAHVSNVQEDNTQMKRGNIEEHSMTKIEMKRKSL